jgi:hypothetical protein
MLLTPEDLASYSKKLESIVGNIGKPGESLTVEVVRQHVIEPREVEIVQIRVEYLRKYLQARQMALLAACRALSASTIQSSARNNRPFRRVSLTLGLRGGG